MIRRIRWMFPAGILFLITAGLLLAQEQATQGQQVQNANQTEEYTDIQQQLQLEKQRNEKTIQQMEARFATTRNYALLSVIAFAITILGICAIITLIFIARARKEKRRHELIGQFLEKGREVPRELLAGQLDVASLSPEQRSAFIRLHNLRSGTWLLCLGLGTGLAVYLWSGDLKYTVWCLILLFLSAGFYINALCFSGKSDFNRK